MAFHRSTMFPGVGGWRIGLLSGALLAASLGSSGALAQDGRAAPERAAKLTYPRTFRIFDDVKDPERAVLLPAVARFEIRDESGNVHPDPTGRERNFTFHPQVYLQDQESIPLPAGRFTIEYGRGPEYLTRTRVVELGEQPGTLVFRLERWIDPAAHGWWSGDLHIHGAGCAANNSPVGPDIMLRQIQGEDLKVGNILVWAPSFDEQSEYFAGQLDPNSEYPYLLRYDVELSGFGCFSSGHLSVSGLRDIVYPGSQGVDGWPTHSLTICRWAKAQGALVGYPHSGLGLGGFFPDPGELPNYIVPPFTSIGAMSYIVNLTHRVPGKHRPGQGHGEVHNEELVPAVDYIATVNTPYPWELNIWYHALNCGFRTRISGETDFPCVLDNRVGAGRSYVKIKGELTFDAWLEGIRQGRSYVTEGASHILDFQVDDTPVGEKDSEVHLDRPGQWVQVRARVAALLDETPDPALANLEHYWQPYWHIERARIGATNMVPVDLVVNGVARDSQLIRADGTFQDVTFSVRVKESSWIALRILPSSHTNPVFVLVQNQPIRANRRSAQWMIQSVKQYWSIKRSKIAPNELPGADRAYRHALKTYIRIWREHGPDGTSYQPR